MSLIVIGVIVLALLILIPMSVKIVSKHERGVAFCLRRLASVTDSGLCLIIPFIDHMVKVDPKVEPTDADGYFCRGVVHSALRMVPEAIKDFERCISLSAPESEKNKLMIEQVKEMIHELRTLGYISRLKGYSKVR